MIGCWGVEGWGRLILHEDRGVCEGGAEYVTEYVTVGLYKPGNNSECSLVYMDVNESEANMPEKVIWGQSFKQTGEGEDADVSLCPPLYRCSFIAVSLHSKNSSKRIK